MENFQRFHGQVAVVTGGASGLGKGISKRLAIEGGKVAVIDINQEGLTAFTNELKEKNLEASGYKVDITNESEIKNAFEQVESKYGKIDIMIHCAGIPGPTGVKIANFGTDDFDRVYSINLRGSFLMTKYAVKAMKKNHYGRILLMASIAGKEGNPNMVGYSTTKAGVIGLVKAVGKEYANTGIVVNGLAPAVIKTEMNAKTDPEQVAYMVSKIPMGRLGAVEEVASIAAWIVSKECSFSTGFVFDISGGRATY